MFKINCSNCQTQAVLNLFFYKMFKLLNCGKVLHNFNFIQYVYCNILWLGFKRANQLKNLREEKYKKAVLNLYTYMYV